MTKKLLSVRLEKSLYDKIAKSPVGISEFVRQSVIQRLDGEKPKEETKSATVERQFLNGDDKQPSVPVFYSKGEINAMFKGFHSKGEIEDMFKGFHSKEEIKAMFIEIINSQMQEVDEKMNVLELKINTDFNAKINDLHTEVSNVLVILRKQKS